MIAVKHLTKFITDDSYDKFKYELKMCIIERITHKLHLVKLYNGTFYLWLFVKIIKIFTQRIRTLLIDKLIDKITTNDYLEFECLFNNYNLFSQYRSYKKHYESC